MDKLQLTKALFLDRDGVINEDSGYLYQPENFQFRAGVVNFIREFIQRGYQPIIVTNQSGIARGYYNVTQFQALTDWMNSQFVDMGIPAIPVYYCPHHPTQGIGRFQQHCFCRKPQPGMLLQAAREHQLDTQQSYMVGDSWRDIQAGYRAGVRKLLFVNKANMAEQDDYQQIAPYVTQSADMTTALSAINSRWKSE